jgi:methylmalonyl-CoA/ethylmalonyl-CoA epimerase
VAPGDSEGSDLIFDHIGIVVAELEGGCRTLNCLLTGLQWTRHFEDERLGVSVRFAQDRAGIVYEIIAPLTDKSPIARTVQSRNSLLNQIAYRTRALEPAVRILRAQGAVPVGRAATAVAFGGARVQFLMTPLGFLFELIEIDRVVHEFS